MVSELPTFVPAPVWKAGAGAGVGVVNGAKACIAAKAMLQAIGPTKVEAIGGLKERNRGGVSSPIMQFMLRVCAHVTLAKPTTLAYVATRNQLHERTSQHGNRIFASFLAAKAILKGQYTVMRRGCLAQMQVQAEVEV